MTRQYNAGGNSSDIGASQLSNDFFYQKKALIEMAKEQYFGQQADVQSMPKHMGKTIKRYLYLPMLDDANVNDQGIDASGVSTTMSATIKITLPEVLASANGRASHFIVGEGANAAAAITAVEAAAQLFFRDIGGFDITAAATDTYDETKAVVEALNPAWVVDDSLAQTGTVVSAHGNLYGSSKDVGTIAAKLPALSESGGRVNRVGFKRVELQGSLEKFGFFDEYTQESIDFDTDAELMMHVNREMTRAANEITEDALQIDLLNSAGVIRYAGDAISTASLSGDTGGITLVTYDDLMRLSIDLDNNRCPKNTTLITGSRRVDTKTVQGARYIYMGTELVTQIKRMTDTFGNQAFISIEKYASAGTVARGEIGQADQLKILVVPEMMHWAGAGAAVGTNAGYRETGGNYDVFPMLVVGDESFTTIGFQTDGKTVKFKIKHSKPGSPESYANDPYGETGFMSIKWYYGFMALRSERIALIKTVAEL